MSRLPTVKPEKLEKFLEYLGFICVRQKGSHKFFKHPDGRTATLPFHKGEDISRGLLSKILKDIEVDREEFIRWVNK